MANDMRMVIEATHLTYQSRVYLGVADLKILLLLSISSSVNFAFCSSSVIISLRELNCLPRFLASDPHALLVCNQCVRQAGLLVVTLYVILSSGHTESSTLLFVYSGSTPTSIYIRTYDSGSCVMLMMVSLIMSSK